MLGLLAQGGVARERVRVGLDRRVARDVLADVDDRAPLREPCAELIILVQSLAQAVEAFGDGLAGAEGQGLRARVHLDAGDRAGRLDQLRQRRSVLRLLPDRLVIEDDARDIVPHGVRRAEQQLAVVAAVVGRRLDADGVEALLDRRRAFVRRQDALARLHHRLSDFRELVQIHSFAPRFEKLCLRRRAATAVPSEAPRLPAAPCLPAIPKTRRPPSRHR